MSIPRTRRISPSNHSRARQRVRVMLASAAAVGLSALPGAQAQAIGPAPAPPFNIEALGYPCPDANNASATDDALRGALACATNKIRCEHGQKPLSAISLSTRPPTASNCNPSGYSITLGYVPTAPAGQTPLAQAAQRKAERIVHCQQFSHRPCTSDRTPNGDDPFMYVTEVGYLPNACMVRENLYAATPAGASTAQGAADSWFNEPPDSTGRRGHRDNMLASDVYETGVGVASGLLPAAVFGRTGRPIEARVWVQLYGAKTWYPNPCR
jgi:hypothetical protein